MSDKIKRMNLDEFRDLGYLQELNRRFLHPLGLALEVIMEEGKVLRLGGIWDYRDGPEGMGFDDKLLNTKEAGKKMNYVCNEELLRVRARTKLFGHRIQPIRGKRREKND